MRGSKRSNTSAFVAVGSLMNFARYQNKIKEKRRLKTSKPAEV
jgi:hypothetical protein